MSSNYNLITLFIENNPKAILGGIKCVTCEKCQNLFVSLAMSETEIEEEFPHYLLNRV